jgi:hypothetical protein
MLLAWIKVSVLHQNRLDLKQTMYSTYELVCVLKMIRYVPNGQVFYFYLLWKRITKTRNII